MTVGRSRRGREIVGITALAALFAAVGIGLLLETFFGVGAAIAKTAKDIPTRQSMDAMNDRGVKNPDAELGFDFIICDNSVC